MGNGRITDAESITYHGKADGCVFAAQENMNFSGQARRFAKHRFYGLADIRNCCLTGQLLFVLFYQDRFVTALKQMAASCPFYIKIGGISAVDMVHDLGKMYAFTGSKCQRCCNCRISKRLQGATDVRRRTRRRIGHTSSARQQSRCGTL